MATNDRVLVVGDLHAPYMHDDAPSFLAAVKKKYKPTRVVLAGDEADKHALNYHERDPDLPSSGDELELAIEALGPVYNLFPEADVLDSNHGSLAHRQAKTAGISKKYMRPYGEVLKAPKKWRWHSVLRLTCGNRDVHFAHGMSANIRQAVLSYGACFVQGHYHTKLEVAYVATLGGQLHWGMTVGCLINDKSYAFAYNKLQLQRPALGSGIIINGNALTLPMYLNQKGRWTGEVP